MKELTPDQFFKQWLRLGPAAATASHFERQVFDEAAPKSVAMKGHRGVRRTGSTTYAAVHNAPDGTYWSNQYHKSRSVQRQFMGHNSRLTAEIARYYAYIFNGLPGIPNAPTP